MRLVFAALVIGQRAKDVGGVPGRIAIVVVQLFTASGYLELCHRVTPISCSLSLKARIP